MPARDGSGPLGRGPRTGRGLGFCNVGNAVKYGAGLVAGLGVVGLGLRRGFRRFGAGGFGRYGGLNPYNAKTQKELLIEQRDLLQERLNLIRKQLEDL